jgi:hypothetical protein
MSYSDSFLLKDTLELAKKYSISIFVETGCQDGYSLKILHSHFDKIYSCDIQAHYVTNAKLYNIEHNNIEIVHMDGADHLEYLIENDKLNNNNFILYSDGHHIKNELGNTTEINELNVLIKYGIKPFIIFHDFKNPNHHEFKYDTFTIGDNDINLIKSKLDECYGLDGYTLQYNQKSQSGVGYLIVIPK